MPVTGRKPKPPGEAVTRHKPTTEWTEVPDVPFSSGPKLPAKRPTILGPKPWSARSKQWWSVISSMPHCVLWTPSDWEFALDTAHIAAPFHAGEDMRPALAAELRSRERILGTTLDYRRDLRIRYVPVKVEAESTEDAGVTRMSDYRDL